MTSIMTEQRRTPFAPELMVRAAIAWGVICVLMLVTDFRAISVTRFPDPDDIMRLIQVRDLLGGQGWFDLNQHRVDAPAGGVPMHWSRLVDIPLAAMIWILSLVLSQSAAEATALVLVPLMTMGCALLLAGRIAWRLMGREAAVMACLAMALCVPLISQMRPLRIDHHGWQIVLALAAMNGLMARNPRCGGLVTGLVLALWMSISMEGLPLAVAICGIGAWRWLRDRHQSVWFVSIMASLAISSVGLFLATRGFADLAQHCDAISPVHLTIFAWGAVAAWTLSRFEPIPRTAVIGGMALTGAGAVGILLAAAPQCAGGGFATLDPVVAEFWYNGVGEGLPVWHQSASLALQIVVPPVIAIWAAFRLAAQSTSWLRQWWYEYAAVLIAALAVALFVTRAGAVAGALAAVPLGWQIALWIRNARNMRKPGKRVLALAGVSLALLPTLPLTLFTLAMPANASPSGKTVRTSSCELAESSAALKPLPPGEILAPLDIGPRLLYGTDHSVIATGHHRGHMGMRLVIETFMGSEAQAHATVQARGTSYLALCPDLVEPARYAKAAPGGFMDQLLEGEEPAWLEPVAVPGEGNMKIWKVVR